MIINFLYRLKNRLIESYIPVFFKCMYGARFGRCGEMRLQKGSEIILEGKKSSCFFEGNFSSRKAFLLRVCDNAQCIIGKNVFFNNYCSVTSMKKIEIGDDCIFGENVKIYDHNHNYKDKEYLIREQGCSADEVVIGNNCWIGSKIGRAHV